MSSTYFSLSCHLLIYNLIVGAVENNVFDLMENVVKTAFVINIFEAFFLMKIIFLGKENTICRQAVFRFLYDICFFIL